MARGAANDSQWSTRLSRSPRSSTTPIRPEPTSAPAPMTSATHYTSLAWLAGNAANRMGRPADAARMFDLYARAAQARRRPGPRASTGRRAPPTRAGQAAAERMPGSSRPRRRPTSFTASSRSSGSDAGSSRRPPASPRRRRRSAPLSRAGRWPRPPARSARSGQWSDQSLFIRALAQQAETDQRARADRRISAARSAGRTSASGWRARRGPRARTFMPGSASPRCRSRRAMRATGRSPMPSPARRARSTAPR